MFALVGDDLKRSGCVARCETIYRNRIRFIRIFSPLLNLVVNRNIVLAKSFSLTLLCGQSTSKAIAISRLASKRCKVRRTDVKRISFILHVTGPNTLLNLQSTDPIFCI